MLDLREKEEILFKNSYFPRNVYSEKILLTKVFILIGLLAKNYRYILSDSSHSHSLIC